MGDYQFALQPLSAYPQALNCQPTDRPVTLPCAIHHQDGGNGMPPRAPCNIPIRVHGGGPGQAAFLQQTGDLRSLWPDCMARSAPGGLAAGPVVGSLHAADGDTIGAQTCNAVAWLYWMARAPAPGWGARRWPTLNGNAGSGARAGCVFATSGVPANTRPTTSTVG